MEQPPRKLSGKRIAVLPKIWRAVLNKYSPKGNCVFRQRTISQVPVTDGAHTDISVCVPVFKRGPHVSYCCSRCRYNRRYHCIRTGVAWLPSYRIRPSSLPGDGNIL